MQARSKLIIVSLTAALLMALAVGSASANRLSISGGRLWRAVFRPLRFLSVGATATSCEVTLEGSFHSGTIRKVERALIGHISRASVGRCEVGSATVLNETLPWHVQYLGFEGRLPEITRVRLILVGAGFQIKDGIFGQVCLSRTSEAEPAAGLAELGRIEAGGNLLVEILRADESKVIRCGASLSGSFEGSATVAEVSSGSRLLLRLI
jgi:hypothetical protein